jgi:aminoglycoside 2'-N-acetyltransferase I
VPSVTVFTTQAAAAPLLDRVRRLLDEAFEGRFSPEDWEHALGGWHVVVVDDDVPLAHAAVVPRALVVGGRPWRAGYVEGVATATGRHGEGLGSLAMTHIDRLVRREFHMGALSTARHTFYEGLGWERWRGPTFVRRGRVLVRTEEDDDGLMVLRHGPSLGLDLTAPITCEARPGDDW